MLFALSAWFSPGGAHMRERKQDRQMNAIRTIVSIPFSRFARLAAIASAALEVSCAGTGDVPNAPSVTEPLAITDAGAPRADANLTWLVTLNAIDLIRAQDGGAALVNAHFDNDHTYVLGGLADAGDVPPHAVIAASFTTYGAFDAVCGDAGTKHLGGLHAALSAGLDRKVGAVVYDNEHWCLTPPNEQQAPAAYEALAAADVHASSRTYPLTYLSTPATDLVRAIEPRYTGPTYPEYLRLGLAREAARVADVFDIQSQGSIPAVGTGGGLSTFTSFVTDAAAQARDASSHVTIVAGLSTNACGGDPSSYTLCQAVMQTRGAVGGYWLNIPSPGDACPCCGASRADIAVNLLKQLQAGRCDPNANP
jgi:hypothetical protein